MWKFRTGRKLCSRAEKGPRIPSARERIYTLNSKTGFVVVIVF